MHSAVVENDTHSTGKPLAAYLADVSIHTHAVQASKSAIRGAVEIGAPSATHRGCPSCDDAWFLVGRVDRLTTFNHRCTALLA